MGLKWDTDHMEKGLYLDENNRIKEVKNVFLSNGKIDNSHILIDNKKFHVDYFQNYYDYNTSFDDIQFSINKDETDIKMIEVLEELASIKEIDTSYYSKKILATKEEKTYFCKRKNSLAGTFFFYHNNVEEHRHFHIMLPKNIPTGKDHLKLRTELNKVFIKYELIPNCEIIVAANETNRGRGEIKTKFQQYKKQLESISWLYKQAESKVTNPNKSVKEFLESKKFNYQGIEIYQNGRFYFTVQTDKNFIFKKLSLKGQNKGEIIERKAYSLNEVLKNYTQYAERAGSKKFVIDIIERVEKIDNIKIDKSFIQKYEEIDTTDSLKTLELLKNKIAKGEKINQEFKEFWRENIKSELPQKRELAKGIAELYKFRQNKVYEFDYDSLNKKYEEYKEKLERTYKILSNEEIEIILSTLKKLIPEEKISKKNICNRIKSELDSRGIEIKDIKIEETEKEIYIICDKNQIDISKIIKNNCYGNYLDKNFKSISEIIKYNKILSFEFKDIKNNSLKNITKVLSKSIAGIVVLDCIKPDILESIEYNVSNEINKMELNIIDYKEKFPTLIFKHIIKEITKKITNILGCGEIYHSIIGEEVELIKESINKLEETQIEEIIDEFEYNEETEDEEIDEDNFYTTYERDEK